MSPLATSQPSGSHRRSPQPCSHGCSLPRKPCLLQSHREAGFPLPEPQILLLVAGKGFPNAAGWGCAGAPGKVQREGGRMERRKEGRSSGCCWDGLPRGDMALPQGAARSEGAGKQEGEAGRAGAEGQGFICTSSISWAPASAPLAPLIPLLPTDPACPLLLIDTFQSRNDDRSRSVRSAGAAPIHQALSCCQGRGRKQKIYRFN